MDVHSRAGKDYKAGMKYRDLSKKYKISFSTIKAWRKRYGWTRDTQSKGGAPFGNKNAKGSNASHKGNKNALKHGLLAKYLPPETMEIVNDLKDASPLAILKANIQIKFAAILRAQQIMFVVHKEDNTEIRQDALVLEVKGYRRARVTRTIDTKVLSAIEKEAKFLEAQARAMSVLTKMIREYEELSHEEIGEDIKESLKQSQLRLANKSAAMGIFLGKQYLGQKDDKYEYNEEILKLKQREQQRKEEGW